jgi:hypothetical protein
MQDVIVPRSEVPDGCLWLPVRQTGMLMAIPLDIAEKFNAVLCRDILLRNPGALFSMWISSAEVVWSYAHSDCRLVRVDDLAHDLAHDYEYQLNHLITWIIGKDWYIDPRCPYRRQQLQQVLDRHTEPVQRT